MEKVHVEASRSYDILIEKGLLGLKGAQEIKKVLQSDTVAILTDDLVAGLYLNRLEQALQTVGIAYHTFVFPNGEKSKCFETYQNAIHFLAEHRINRKDSLIALGGGVVGDLTGFTAATYLRGIPFIQIPTTLLACVDSSVGGKTAIDVPAGKNLCGAFHQPSLVLCDPELLDTLDRENYKSGMAEVIKYALMWDAEFHSDLMEERISIDKIIARCVDIKREIVQQDEFDTGVRGLLNFGHTLGHGIEACANFSLLHGICVAIGMAKMTTIAYQNGLCDKKTLDAVYAILNKYELPTTTNIAFEDVLSKMLSDKKVMAKNIHLVIPCSIGNCRMYTLPVDRLTDFAKKGFEC